MKTVLVTGSEGYIGSEFVLKYKDRFNIISMDRINSDRKEHFTGHYLDFLDCIDGIKIDAVLHLAALVGFVEAPAEQFFEENLINTNRLVEWAVTQDIPKFLYASTQAIYASINNQEGTGFQEDTTELVHPYAMSKLYSEASISQAQEPYVYRQSTVIGKNTQGKYFGFIDAMCNSVLMSKKMRIVGGDKNRSLILLDDLIDIYAASIDGTIPPGTYNTSFVDTSIGEAGRATSAALHKLGYDHSLETVENEGDPNVSYHSYCDKVLQFYNPICSSIDAMVNVAIDRWVN